MRKTLQNIVNQWDKLAADGHYGDMEEAIKGAKLMLVRTDTEILEALSKNLYWDGYGFWLPDLCVMKDPHFMDNKICPAKPPTLDEFRIALNGALLND